MGNDALFRAFDEARFGASRTLNLRAQQPTALQAAKQTEQWLRRLQVESGKQREALIITGRGNQSVDGFSPVREAIAKLLPSLRRRAIISGYVEHSPGSFVVTLASVNSMLEAGKRRREKKDTSDPVRNKLLADFDSETAQALRDLASATLSALGVATPTIEQEESEVARQFSRLVAALPNNPDREALLQQAIQRALEELEDQ